MIDFDILKQFNTTDTRLREVFSARPPSDTEALTPDDRKKREQDFKTREKFETRIQQRLQEGIVFSLKNYRLYAAVDLAWDSNPVNKETLPLMLYAQGKINLSACVKDLEGLSCADKFVEKDPQSGAIKKVNIPKFTEVAVSPVRSFITRRLAAQSNKYANAWPFYKYESRSTSTVGKLRADALSARVDIMADQFGHRHHDTQVMRDAFLYGHSVDFLRCNWEVEKQYRRKDLAPELQASPAADVKIEVEEEIVKEGVCFTNPHPTRVFWDTAAPLAAINEDNGPAYLGFWDIRRYGDIQGDPNYFNRENITYNMAQWGIYGAYQAYFSQYCDVIAPPPCPNADSVSAIALSDPSAANDRKNLIGLYNGDLAGSGIFYANYYEKVVPKDEGLGDYPFPVWLRTVVAGDRTIIFAQWMPTAPAGYCGFNENDGRQVNISFAHELMPYQDQMTNLLSQMLMLCQAEMFKVFAINIDALPEKNRAEALKIIRAQLQGDNWAGKPLVIEWSLSRLQDLGFDVNKIVSLTETKVSTSITAIFQAMIQVLQLAERLTAMSPNELGQPSPREISAQEAGQMGQSTNTVYEFISEGVDEFRAAKKRMIYDCLVSCAQGHLRVPVINRYSSKVITAAGFTTVQGEDEEWGSDIRKRTVIGTYRKLIHDYIFTSRDGSERAMNAQSATVLMQLLSQIMAFPSIYQALGKERLYEMLNEVFRLSGAGVDLKLELQEGEDNSLGADEMEQLGQIVQQLATTVQQIQKQSQATAGQVEQINEGLNLLPELATAVKKATNDIAKVFGKVDELKDDVSESINYKDAPDDIKRQMEMAAGYRPSQNPTRNSNIVPKKVAA